MGETKTGSLLTSSDKREISALITFKGGLVCSFGNGKVIVLQVQTSKDDDDIRFKVADIIKLPIRNPTTAGLIFQLHFYEYHLTMNSKSEKLQTV